MSRISRGYLPAGRNAPAGAGLVPSALLRRGKALAGAPSGEGEEILDLFSRTRRGYSISSSGESDVLNRMEKKISVGLAKAGRAAAEEFLSVEIGKHDYDWLLTPPGTPLFSSVDSTDHQPLTTCQRSSSNLRSASLVKPSRLSVPQSETSSHANAPRMARSSSTTRASFSSSSRTPSSILNTSTASVNSRPTTPANRARTPATTGPRPTTSRSSTPARTRPISITPAAEKPKPVTQTSRPSTPTTRAHFHASSMSSSDTNSIHTRPTSRPSTPTRRPPPPAPNSRPSSPARSRTPAQPNFLPDFPLDAPPNLRTKLPERPISAGRQRPGMELTVRGNSNVEAAGSGVRRSSSPAMSRGRIAENQAKGSRANGHRDGLKLAENQKPTVPEKKPVKPALGGETGGYGRTLSKNSLNMAIKHMDIRPGMSGMRGASLFPHSIRSTPAAAAAAANTLKTRLASRADPPPPAHNNRISDHTTYNNELMPPKNYNESSFESEEFKPAEVEYIPVKRIDMKVNGSLNWLQSLDDEKKPDRRFHPFPEPFILI